jgi:hypothetical protein
VRARELPSSAFGGRRQEEGKSERRDQGRNDEVGE